MITANVIYRVFRLEVGLETGTIAARSFQICPRDLAEKCPCPCQGLYLALSEIAEIADAWKAIRSEGTVGS